MIDAYLPAPGAGRDEGFHRGVSELLEEWAHEAAPALPAVRIIAPEQSARAHELRDLLARNRVPYASTPPSRRTAGCGCSGPGRTAQRCRS
jgi:thioredoxin reductase (NADPH)